MSFSQQFGCAGCFCLFLLLSQSLLSAAVRNPAGRDIFRQHCAKCHGRNGEGVNGKYDGPLQGDRPLEKLTRYIERNMPDDAPGTCTGDEAAAVAKYIYDAFYSAEARLRTTKPPRVELARLTNRQYLNSVADLLKEFTGRDAALNDVQGLSAIYYNSRNLNDDNKVIARVDREIDFDFGEKSPDPKCDGTNGFSIRWRGSLKADETGEYEFVLKTPNGSRLWVNEEEEPLIDAWVASGQTSEHKAVRRLIGGRAYPIKLNIFKYKEKQAAISLQWKPPKGAQQPIPARNLSPSATTPTFVVSTPFPADDSSYGYERGVSISKAWDEAATAAAVEVANYLSTNLDRFSGSKSADTNRAEKIQTLCDEFVTAAFRRPLSQQQSNVYIIAQFKKAPKIEDAVKRVVLLTLKSPRFLYPGLQEEKPDGFTVAERLASGLWDSLPDAELRRAAAQNSLHTREQVANQARRMLVADERAHAKMQVFFHHWLQMDRVENLSKDDKLFPGFTPAIIADLRSSLDIFLENTMWSDGSDYRTLLLADYLFLNKRLAEFYGVNTNETDGFVKTTLGSNQRSGVLTHPYLLAAFSYQRLTSPIHRGVFLTRNIVGRALKPPPMAMTFKDSDFAPNLTMREKVSQLTRPQNCQSCHSVINPLGFSLEQYDPVGRFRMSDQDRPIDPISDYLTEDGQLIRLTGARDVAEFAIHSDQAQNAFIQQLFHHAVKQPLLAYGADTLKHLRQTFVAANFNMQQLLVEMVTVAAMRGIEKPSDTVALSRGGTIKEQNHDQNR